MSFIAYCDMNHKMRFRYFQIENDIIVYPFVYFSILSTTRSDRGMTCASNGLKGLTTPAFLSSASVGSYPVLSFHKSEKVISAVPIETPTIISKPNHLCLSGSVSQPPHPILLGDYFRPELTMQSTLAVVESQQKVAQPASSPPPASSGGPGSRMRSSASSEIAQYAYSELERVEAEVRLLLPLLGKHRIEGLQRLITKYFNKRFKGKNRIPLYGSLNKGFNEQQLQVFFKAIDNPKYLLLFSFQAYCGLRIGEAIRVNINDVNFQTRELKIKSEKTNLMDRGIIPIHLFQQLQEFIAKHKAEIDKAGGCIFFKEEGKSSRKDEYLDVDYARKKFRDYIIKAGLNEEYGESEESSDKRRRRRLHILTTHSLRHYAITKFYNQTKNWLLTSKFARHVMKKLNNKRLRWIIREMRNR